MMAIKVTAYLLDGTTRKFSSAEAAKKAAESGMKIWFIVPELYDEKIEVLNKSAGIMPNELWKRRNGLNFIDSKGEVREIPYFGSPLNDWTFKALDRKEFVRILAESSTWEEVEEKVKIHKQIDSLQSEIRLLKFQKQKLQEENNYLREEVKRLQEKLDYYDLSADDIPNEIRRHIIGLLRSLKKEFETVDC